jgi:hypothetical protein
MTRWQVESATHHAQHRCRALSGKHAWLHSDVSGCAECAARTERASERAACLFKKVARVLRSTRAGLRELCACIAAQAVRMRVRAFVCARVGVHVEANPKRRALCSGVCFQIRNIHSFGLLECFARAFVMNVAIETCRRDALGTHTCARPHTRTGHRTRLSPFTNARSHSLMRAPILGLPQQARSRRVRANGRARVCACVRVCVCVCVCVHVDNGRI